MCNAEWYQMSKKDSSYKMEGPCSAEVSGYLEDYKKPEGYTEDPTIAITAEQLKEKLSQFNK